LGVLNSKFVIKEVLNIQANKTFFNDVISECYYAIFYCAKAYLLLEGIKTKSPNEHKRTYNKFKKIVESKKLDRELAKVYDEESEKAEVLLKIFFNEKKNRGRFTYNINANANLPFAQQSIKNARFFVSTIKHLIENKE